MIKMKKKKKKEADNTLAENHEHIDVIISHPEKFKVQVPQIKLLSSMICQLLGLEGWELCIKFVESDEIAYLNKLYRAKDRPTDVLSFPQQEWPAPVRVHSVDAKLAKDAFNLLGDIVISLDEAQKNAEEIGQQLDREVCFLLVHGILHLCGHDHIKEYEEIIMLDEQKLIMSSLYDSNAEPFWQGCVRVSE